MFDLSYILAEPPTQQNSPLLENDRASPHDFCNAELLIGR